MEHAAVMVLEPGGSTGGADEPHEIACGSGEPLRTINVYAPPVY